MVSDLRCRRLPVASAWTPVGALGILAEVHTINATPMLVLLAGIWVVLISGMVLLIVAVTGARIVRRLIRHQRPRSSRMVGDRWYEKPLVEDGDAVGSEQRQCSWDEPDNDDESGDSSSGDDP